MNAKAVLAWFAVGGFGWCAGVAAAQDFAVEGPWYGPPARYSSSPGRVKEYRMLVYPTDQGKKDAGKPVQDLLPDDARELVTRHEAEAAAIQKDVRRNVRKLRDRLIVTLKGLQDRYTRAAQLDEAVAIRDRIAALEQGGTSAPSDPGTLSSFTGQIGRSFVFRVRGSNWGAVWGTDAYAADSTLAAAAVHAGVLKTGQTGVVRVKMLPGRASYQASTSHGIASHARGSASASFQVAPVDEEADEQPQDPPPEVSTPLRSPPYDYRPGYGTYQAVEEGPIEVVDTAAGFGWMPPPGGLAPVTPAASLPDDARPLVERFEAESAAVRKAANLTVCKLRRQIVDKLAPLQDKYAREGRLDEAIAIRTRIRALKEPVVKVLTDPGMLYQYYQQIGRVFYFRVTGHAQSSLWGSDAYTGDSSLATAAVHAGVLKDGQTGIVKVTILPGQTAYEGTLRNGVSSMSYGSYHASYKVESGAEDGVSCPADDAGVKPVRGAKGPSPKPATAVAHDPTLSFYLSKAALVVLAEVAAAPAAAPAPGAASTYRRVRVVEVIKGTFRASAELDVRLLDGVAAAKAVELTKGKKYILFLNPIPAGRPGVPAFQTADRWFGVQQFSPELANSLKSAATKGVQPSLPRPVMR